MEPWQFFSQLRHIIQHDPGGRGLDRVAGRNLFTHCAADLETACRSLADTREPIVAIVTGFYIPAAAAYETDGPLGALLLAEVLHALGARVTLAAEPELNAILEVALRLGGLEDAITLQDLPLLTSRRVHPGGLTPDSTETIEVPSGSNPPLAWAQDAWSRLGPLTHLIFIERVGPSHTLATMAAQPRPHPAPTGDFTRQVTPATWNRPHNMRGIDIADHTAPVHLLIETLRPGIQTIGIGDGGNEIGMGKLPWELIAANITNGAQIACRVPVHHLLAAGTSNWGAYALAAGVTALRRHEDAVPLFDADREAHLWHTVLNRTSLVDGVTGRRELSVDGLSWNEYRQTLDAIGALLRSVRRG